MSDLTDKSFVKWACNRLTEDVDFDKKKIIFSDEAHFDLDGYVSKSQTEKPHAYIEKPTQPKRVTHCLVLILILTDI